MADDDIDHRRTDEVVCPHCGHICSESWEFGDDDTHECPICDKPFGITRNHTVTYTTHKIEESDEDEDEAADEAEETDD